MEELLETMGALFWLVVGIVAIVPLVLFSISYNRVRSRSLLMTAVAFGLFFLKGLLLGARLIIPEGIEDTTWYLNDGTGLLMAAFLDILIIGLITASLLLGKGSI